MYSRLKKALVLTAAVAALAFCPARARAADAIAPKAVMPAFEDVKKLFDYDSSQPLNPAVRVEKETTYYTKYHVSYASVNNQRVTAFFYVPKATIKDYNASLKPEDKERFDKRINTLDGPPWPTIFLMHWLQSDKSLADAFAPQLTLYGYAVFAIDGVWKGERAAPGRNILEYDPKKTVANIQQQVIDIRRGTDYLATRTDLVDMKRYGYFGISMGSLTGAPAVAVDDRFLAVVLADGAADLAAVFKKSDLPEFKEEIKKIQETGYTLEEAFEILKPIDPLIYAPHISPRPALLINGKFDEIFPKEAMQALHDATGDPKKSVWYNSGHILPVNSVIIQMLTWFKLYLAK